MPHLAVADCSLPWATETQTLPSPSCPPSKKHSQHAPPILFISAGQQTARRGDNVVDWCPKGQGGFALWLHCSLPHFLPTHFLRSQAGNSEAVPIHRTCEGRIHIRTDLWIFVKGGLWPTADFTRTLCGFHRTLLESRIGKWVTQLK